eukprot:550011-Prymnesium_polylepis.3
MALAETHWLFPHTTSESSFLMCSTPGRAMHGLHIGDRRRPSDRSELRFDAVDGKHLNLEANE